jgi:hypothetical protein
MIIYNVTINVDHAAHDAWLKWMKETHIPEVMATGLFLENRMLRLIGDEDSGGVTYAIQYTATTMSDYENYRDHHAPGLQRKTLELFRDQFTAFRTLLETV